MRIILGIWILFVVYGIAAWIINFIKLLNCDFAPIGREEVIHGLGLIPVFSMVTVWF